MHGSLISAKELEKVYSLMSAECMVFLEVTGNFDTCGTIKTEMSMQVIKWTMEKSKKAKLHKVDSPMATDFKVVSYVNKNEFNLDSRTQLKRGDAPWAKIRMGEEVLQRDTASGKEAELDETNMFQTDSRDRAAGRRL